MKTTKLIFVLLLTLAFSSCNQVKLDNIEAEGLIKRTLELPKSYSYSVGWGQGVSMWGASGPLDALQSAGLITYNIEYHGAFSDPSLYLSTTELGKPYFLGQNSNVCEFKTNDIDFDKITGISINKESQTAIIRFSLKATNVTLAGYALAQKKYIKYSLSGSIIGELVYKKFDSGWQLEAEQAKPSSDLLNQILKSESNANRNDDYTKQIKDKYDEIYVKKNASQAHYSDINAFLSAFKNAILSKDMNEVSKFINFPFFCDYGVITKEEFLSDKFILGVKYFEIFTKTNSFEKYDENHYNLPPLDLGIVKGVDGYWKLNDFLLNEVRGD